MAAGGLLLLPGEGVLVRGQRYAAVEMTLEGCVLPPERLRRSPSALHGLPPHTETQLRVRACHSIQSAGILLRLPQVAMATGQVLFQRFFYSKSFVKISAEMVAMACLHLASKIEEEPRRVRDIMNVFHHLKHSTEHRPARPMSLDSTYINMKNEVINAERRLLKELGFCVHVKHPHKMIVMYLQVLECERNTKLVQMAWNYMNDSLRTDVFLRFKPETIACACIFLAARVLQIPLPERPAWYLLFGATEEDLKEIGRRVLQLYVMPCALMASLLQEVEKRRLALEEETQKGKAGSVMPTMGSPALQPPAGFSPSSKAASPVGVQKNPHSPLSHVALKNACRKLTEEKRRTRLSRSDERRESHSIPSPPRRRRSRSVSSPSHISSSAHRKKPYSVRERERERERWRERERKQERANGDGCASHHRRR